MDKINLGDGTQGSGDNGLVGGGKINANFIALVQAVLGVTIWSSATSENLDLTTLNTTDKSSIKAAINELLERTKLIDDSLTSSIFKTWSVDKLVATFIQASVLANYLERSGGTLTGTLNGTNASFSGNGTFSANLYIEGADRALRINNGAQPIVFLGDGGANTDGQLILYSSAGTANVVFSGDTTQHYIANGNVGIGTTNPTEKLEVNGNAKADSFIKDGGTSSQFLKADGSVDNNTYLQLGDVSSNSNIFTLTNSTSIIEVSSGPNATVNIPTGLDRQEWLFCCSSSSSLTVSGNTGVIITLVHNNNGNNNIISSKHSARLIKNNNTDEQYILIK